MKPFVITPYIRAEMMEIMYPDINRRLRNAYSAPSPNMGYNTDSTRTLLPVYFADDEHHALQVAEGLSLRWPMYNFLVSRVTATVDMPPPAANVRPETKRLSEKGLLP